MIYKIFVENLNKLIDNLPFSKIAIAVSGGSDSIALLHLMSIWTKEQNLELYVMSVDHNLREQAKIENNYVAELCKKFDHMHYILHFNHNNNFSNLQARARESRYELMTNLCKTLDILLLLTAHHQDDYIENFCLRLERKSGPFGLSSNNINWYNNVQIIRPFYNIPKKAIVDYLIVNGIKWFEDESNISDKYRRNVIRKTLNNEPCDRKIEIIEKQSKIDNLLKYSLQPQLVAAIAESTAIYNYGFACVNLAKFNNLELDIQIQLMNFLLITIGCNQTSPRFYSIKVILGLITTDTKFKNTLHGCMIARIHNNLLIYKENGKKCPADVTLQNIPVIWDKRFLVRSVFNRPCTITHLTLSDYKMIKNKLDFTLLKKITFGNHIEILFTLPVVKILEKIIAIPHISYYDDGNMMFEVSFTSGFVSRFTHF